MTTQHPTPGRRRFTIVELLIVFALGGLFAGIAVPILSGGEDTLQVRDLERVQDAVRRFRSDTGSYPTFGATPAPNQQPSGIWVAGGLPGADSAPSFAGIDFTVKATRLNQQSSAALVPDYLPEKPRHAGSAADDATQRWRIDKDGNISVELDGRSY